MPLRVVGAQIRSAAAAMVDTATLESGLPASFCVDLLACPNAVAFDLLVTGAGMLDGQLLEPHYDSHAKTGVAVLTAGTQVRNEAEWRNALRHHRARQLFAWLSVPVPRGEDRPDVSALVATAAAAASLPGTTDMDVLDAGPRIARLAGWIRVPLLGVTTPDVALAEVVAAMVQWSLATNGRVRKGRSLRAPVTREERDAWLLAVSHLPPQSVVSPSCVAVVAVAVEELVAAQSPLAALVAFMANTFIAYDQLSAERTPQPGGGDAMGLGDPKVAAKARVPVPAADPLASPGIAAGARLQEVAVEASSEDGGVDAETALVSLAVACVRAQEVAVRARWVAVEAVRRKRRRQHAQREASMSATTVQAQQMEGVMDGSGWSAADLRALRVPVEHLPPTVLRAVMHAEDLRWTMIDMLDTTQQLLMGDVVPPCTWDTAAWALDMVHRVWTSPHVHMYEADAASTEAGSRRGDEPGTPHALHRADSMRAIALHASGGARAMIQSGMGVGSAAAKGSTLRASLAFMRSRHGQTDAAASARVDHILSESGVIPTSAFDVGARGDGGVQGASESKTGLASLAEAAQSDDGEGGEDGDRATTGGGGGGGGVPRGAADDEQDDTHPNDGEAPPELVDPVLDPTLAHRCAALALAATGSTPSILQEHGASPSGGLGDGRRPKARKGASLPVPSTTRGSPTTLLGAPELTEEERTPAASGARLLGAAVRALGALLTWSSTSVRDGTAARTSLLEDLGVGMGAAFDDVADFITGAAEANGDDAEENAARQRQQRAREALEAAQHMLDGLQHASHGGHGHGSEGLSGVHLGMVRAALVFTCGDVPAKLTTRCLRGLRVVATDDTHVGEFKHRLGVSRSTLLGHLLQRFPPDPVTTTGFSAPNGSPLAYLRAQAGWETGASTVAPDLVLAVVQAAQLVLSWREDHDCEDDEGESSSRRVEAADSDDEEVDSPTGVTFSAKAVWRELSAAIPADVDHDEFSAAIFWGCVAAASHPSVAACLRSLVPDGAKCDAADVLAAIFSEESQPLHRRMPDFCRLLRVLSPPERTSLPRSADSVPLHVLKWRDAQAALVQHIDGGGDATPQALRMLGALLQLWLLQGQEGTAAALHAEVGRCVLDVYVNASLPPLVCTLTVRFVVLTTLPAAGTLTARTSI